LKLLILARYFISIVTSIVSFVISYGLMQYLVTRNIPDNSVLLVLLRFILNFATAGLLSGIFYVAIFKYGYLPLSIIPATLFSGLFLGIAIVHGEIGFGLEYSASINAWQFTVPALIGIFSSYIGANVFRKVLLRRRTKSQPE
jgi:hypothetical protein